VTKRLITSGLSIAIKVDDLELLERQFEQVFLLKICL